VQDDTSWATCHVRQATSSRNKVERFCRVSDTGLSISVLAFSTCFHSIYFFDFWDVKHFSVVTIDLLLLCYGIVFTKLDLQYESRRQFCKTSHEAHQCACDEEGTNSCFRFSQHMAYVNQSAHGLCQCFIPVLSLSSLCSTTACNQRVYNCAIGFAAVWLQNFKDVINYTVIVIG